MANYFTGQSDHSQVDQNSQIEDHSYANDESQLVSQSLSVASCSISVKDWIINFDYIYHSTNICTF